MKDSKTTVIKNPTPQQLVLVKELRAEKKARKKDLQIKYFGKEIPNSL